MTRYFAILSLFLAILAVGCSKETTTQTETMTSVDSTATLTTISESATETVPVTTYETTDTAATVATTATTATTVTTTHPAEKKPVVKTETRREVKIEAPKAQTAPAAKPTPVAAAPAKATTAPAATPAAKPTPDVAPPATATTAPSTKRAPGNPPKNHTVNNDGYKHAPGAENATTKCAMCHGTDLKGKGKAPSCFSCHTKNWS